LFNIDISSPDYIVLIGKDMEGSSHFLGWGVALAFVEQNIK